MARTATRPRLPATPLLVAVLVSAASFLCLAAALATASFAAWGTGAMALFARGGSEFTIDPLRAAVLAPMLLAAAACGVAEARRGWGWFPLVMTSVASILAVDAFTALFWFLIGLTIVVLRGGGTVRLAALPAAGLMLALNQAPIRLDPWLAAAAGLLLLAGAGRAVRAAHCRDLAQAAAIGFSGLGLAAVGLGNDAAVITAVAANAVVAPALGLAAGYLVTATGTDALDWLGGIARGMPRFAVLTSVAIGFAAVLPPGPGFAAFAATWGAADAGGSWPLVIVMAVWFAAMGFAGLRVIGTVCLGRPRSLRAAAAEDAPRPVLIGLALLIAGGAVVAATHAGLLVLAGPMVVIALISARFLRRSGPVDVAAFDDGFARPPAWLPFGDPVTEITATSFADGVRLPARLARIAAVAARWLRP